MIPAAADSGTTAQQLLPVLATSQYLLRRPSSRRQRQQRALRNSIIQTYNAAATTLNQIYSSRPVTTPPAGGASTSPSVSSSSPARSISPALVGTSLPANGDATSQDHLPSQQDRTNKNLTGCAASAAHLYRQSRRFVLSRPRPGATTRDSAAPSTVTPTNHHHQSQGPVNPYAQTRPAVPLVAARVALPKAPGGTRLLDVLPQADLAIYGSANPRLLLPAEQRKLAPKTRVHGPREEYVALVARLLSLNMIELTETPGVINGLFCLEKDDGEQRLILDARPANTYFVEPRSPMLPTPADLVSLESDATLYVAKTDLSSFFHSLELPAFLRPYFCLPGLTSAELGSLAPANNKVFYPMFRTVPMGWSHSVYVAQRSHVKLAIELGGLDPKLQILPGKPVGRLTSYRWLLYIDDLVLVGHDPGELSNLQRGYIEGIHGGTALRCNAKKTVAASSEGVDVLGVELHGQRLEFGLSGAKMQALQERTTALLRRKSATGREVASIAGDWVWATLVQRPAMSLLASVFRFSRIADARVFVLWASVKRELRQLSSLAPLLRVSLCEQPLDFCVASDASSLGQGVVASVVDGGEARLLAAHAGTSSLPVPADVSDTPAEACSEERAAAAAARDAWVQQQRWGVAVSAAWQHAGSHINSLELRAVITAVRWALRFRPPPDHRLLLFCDSSVVVCALSKGRTSAPSLIMLLRRLSALLLATGLSLCPLWLPSAVNPADQPSRQCRPPRSLLRAA